MSFPLVVFASRELSFSFLPTWKLTSVWRWVWYSFVPEANKPATNPTTLSEACAVVDVLGDEVR